MLRGPDARLRLVTALLIAALVPVFVQLLRLQVLEHKTYQVQAASIVQKPYSLPEPPPGSIFDRNGALLVGNVPVVNVGAEVTLIRTVTETLGAASDLAPHLGMTKEDVARRLTPPPSPEKASWCAYPEGRIWCSLADGVDSEAAAKIEKLKYETWPWLTLEPTWQRFYAEGALASHTLGFVNDEGEGYGVEAFQQRFLRPQRIDDTGDVNIEMEPFALEMLEGQVRAYPGTDLRLTIDRTIQAFVEGELEKALVEFKAQGGTILVMDPRNGAILAVAGRPNYEPYDYAAYWERGESDAFVDPVVSVAYEPGSVFKVLTVAAALDSGAVNMNWSYHDTGIIEYGGVSVQNWDRQPYGQQNLQGVVNNSLNVGVATLTTQHTGAEAFYRYLRLFGFGRLTGIGLAGEVGGVVHMPTDLDWQDGFLATNAFGQGITVTPLQMATAVSAIANDGVMMAPHIVESRRFPDGRVVDTPPRVLERPIRAETAQLVTDLMAEAVVSKLTMAQVPGYAIAGKTGTAQIPITGGYDPVDVITSFIGFGPLPDPELLVLVKIDKPGIEPHLRWGTQTAAPVFRRVAERLFVLLGIPPSDLGAGP
ncbi:MAG: peptidoglycan D,D-transpeptidase FtsI family protein [Anaerolineae bacterium]